MKERIARRAWLPAAVLTLAALSAVPCLAQDAAPASPALVVAWAELGAEGLDAEYRNAAALVPRQLMAALAFVERRYQADDEALSMSRKSADAALEAARKAVADARAKRDLAALSVRDPAKRAADVIVADAALAKAEVALAAVVGTASARSTRSAPTAEAEAEPGAKGSVALVRWADHASGALLPFSAEPAKLCAEKKIDLLVHGSVKPKGRFIAVELALYVAILGRDVWTSTEYASADGLGEAVSAFERPAAEALLGRPYARVVFSVRPAEADLYVDGERYFKAGALFVEPGIHEALAKAQGFVETRSLFEAELGTDVAVALELQENDSIGFSLSSDPPGAVIHLDGSIAGDAPFAVPGAAYPRVARVSMPGFDDAQLVIRPESLLEDATVSLSPSDGLSFDDRYDAKKDGFYRSLGWFVASLPVTVLSGGLFQMYYTTLNAIIDDYTASMISPETAARLQSSFYTTQTIFWVSATATLGTAVNAVVRLVLYIKSAR